MRIVIDMQGAQSEGSRSRGIGRYTLSLAQAIARQRGEHEVLLALNGRIPDVIDSIRAAFDGLLAPENIRAWYPVGPVASLDGGNDVRRQRSELMREAFLASLKPDIVHVSSLFEGYGTDAVTSIGALGKLPTSVTLYDLIPYIHRHRYLGTPSLERWYFQKLDHLRRADLWLGISESSRKEGIDYLSLSPSRSVNISTAADAQFEPLELSTRTVDELRDRFNLERPFVMYGGGIDHRKNLEGLIHAFARLPSDLRQTHQLAIVCAVRGEDRQGLLQLARSHGLGAGDLVITGFVPDADLVALYNLCKLFVFPSWHEGFGLPVLEAMQCGAPVIGANTSSIPEVIGWKAALFDPHSTDAITAAIQRCLTDDEFRAELARYGKVRAKEFSWDASARRAIEAFEQLHAERRSGAAPLQVPTSRPKLAYISPLPPAQSGIADYSAELLPELARHYDIELVIAQADVDDAQANACWPMRSVEWFMKHAAEYQRVLYHFGNSEFHEHMFGLLESVPGVVVLHDFFLSAILAHMERYPGAPRVWTEMLYRSHGYSAVRDRYLLPDSQQAVWKYPCNLNVLRRAQGIIVHSAYSRDLTGQWYGQSDHDDWMVVPLLREPKTGTARSSARRSLGLDGEAFIVCSFGIIGPQKQSLRLLHAWLQSALSKDKRCRLIFVGQNDVGPYGQDLSASVKRREEGERIQITGWVEAEQFHQYLAAADVAVQLRTLSRGETSAAVLDCMNHGLATIVNENGSMQELPDHTVWKLPDEFSKDELADALDTLWQDADKRRLLGNQAREHIHTQHNPRRCGDEYAGAIERAHRNAALTGERFFKRMAQTVRSDVDQADAASLAQAAALSFKQRLEQRQLLIDVSELVEREAHTGIQRVVRSILAEWFKTPPAGFRIEPVYATIDQGYRYARQFTLNFLGCPEDALADEPIDYAPGDVFLGLDLQPQVVPAQREFLQALRRHGVRALFVVYDLLCVEMPQNFPAAVSEGFLRWLEVVAESDGAVCISRSTAGELEAWMAEHGSVRHKPFSISWFHLGADLERSPSQADATSELRPALENLSSRKCFLMVGTLEPRKGHAQVLRAFQNLWENGQDLNLVFVGKEGWKVEDLVQAIRNHPEKDSRLFWLDDASDDALADAYHNSTCLIAASYGEGFGLPLIEAAQHGVPVIARDIPVFREVAGENAYYFEGLDPDDIADTVLDWLSLHEQGIAPRSDDMPRCTWRESAQGLLQIVSPKTETAGSPRPDPVSAGARTAD